MKSVIERLRDLREDHDYSQRQIAEVLGITQQRYSAYETGKNELPLRHFLMLADYYGLSTDYLTGRDDDIQNKKIPLETVFVTHDCSCAKLARDTLSLSMHGREAVVEYVALQKLKESQLPESEKKGKPKQNV